MRCTYFLCCDRYVARPLFGVGGAWCRIDIGFVMVFRRAVGIQRLYGCAIHPGSNNLKGALHVEQQVRLGYFQLDCLLRMKDFLFTNRNI